MLSQTVELPPPLASVRTQENIPVLEFFGARLALVLTAADTAGAYSLFDYSAPARYAGPTPHWHKRTTEYFFILSGRLQVAAGGQAVVLGSGEAVHVPPGVVHTFANPHEDPVRFLVYVSPGGFENYFRALRRLVAESTEWPPADRSALEALALEHDTFPPPGP